jgi:hypothetical protein
MCGQQAERAVFQREGQVSIAFRTGFEGWPIRYALKLRHRYGADEDQHAAEERDPADDRNAIPRYR